MMLLLSLNAIATNAPHVGFVYELKNKIMKNKKPSYAKIRAEKTHIETLDEYRNTIKFLEAKCLRLENELSKLRQHDVSNRREQLIAFADAINVCDGDNKKIGKLVDLYLKSN